MSIEMSTQASCCCHHSSQPAVANNNIQTSETFSMVYSSVSLSNYYNPITWESLSENQVGNVQTNNLQAILDKLPAIRQFKNSNDLSENAFNNFFYIRTMAIRIASGSCHGQSNILETVLNNLKLTEDMTEDDCSCHHQEEATKQASDGAHAEAQVTEARENGQDQQHDQGNVESASSAQVPTSKSPAQSIADLRETSQKSRSDWMQAMHNINSPSPLQQFMQAIRKHSV